MAHVMAFQHGWSTEELKFQGTRMIHLIDIRKVLIYDVDYSKQ